MCLGAEAWDVMLIHGRGRGRVCHGLLPPLPARHSNAAIVMQHAPTARCGAAGITAWPARPAAGGLSSHAPDPTPPVVPMNVSSSLLEAHDRVGAEAATAAALVALGEPVSEAVEQVSGSGLGLGGLEARHAAARRLLLPGMQLPLPCAEHRRAMGDCVDLS